MKNSGSSSAKTTNTPLSTVAQPEDRASPLKSFALIGPSVVLDPLHYAVRRDIADVRLADRVFAPHYAEALPTVVTTATQLREGKATDTNALAVLAAGELFEVLELAGHDAWGIAVARQLVGYLDRYSLAER